MKRPISITVIAWILIVGAALHLLTSPVNLSDPKVQELMAKGLLPFPVQCSILYLGLAVALASGIGMLEGRNWARWLYVIWRAIEAIIVLATSPTKLMMIPGIVLFLVEVFFLFRPVANRYFATGSTPNVQDM
ncbi:MAG: hypothetical protein ABR915_19830 [Thermoguttaceae bacterium]